MSDESVLAGQRSWRALLQPTESFDSLVWLRDAGIRALDGVPAFAAGLAEGLWQAGRDERVLRLLTREFVLADVYERPSLWIRAVPFEPNAGAAVLACTEADDSAHRLRSAQAFSLALLHTVWQVLQFPPVRSLAALNAEQRRRWERYVMRHQRSDPSARYIAGTDFAGPLSGLLGDDALVGLRRLAVDWPTLRRALEALQWTGLNAAAAGIWQGGAGARGVQVEIASESEPLVGEEPQHWIELQYLHHDGSGVAGARYVVTADGYRAEGALDAAGTVHLAGVPASVSQFEYEFRDDPGEYQPQPPSADTSEATTPLEDALDWLWGLIQGDFNEEQSISQMAVNALIGLIPIADQVLDVRDLIAGIKHLVDFYGDETGEAAKAPEMLGLSRETWLWLGLFLIAVGCIPTVGSAVKGVLKMLIRALQDAGAAAGKLSAKQLAQIWAQLMAVLNKLGVKQGNAHRWLKTMRGDLPKHMDAAAEQVRGAVGVLQEMLSSIEGLVRRLDLGSERAKQALVAIATVRKSIGRLLAKLETQKRLMSDWLAAQLDLVIEAAGGAPRAGRVDTPPAGGSNRLVQEARAPGEPAAVGTRTGDSAQPGPGKLDEAVEAGSDFAKYIDEFATLDRKDFRAWKQALGDQGLSEEQISDIVYAGSLRRGDNLWGDNWKKYLEEISATTYPGPPSHAHHLVEKVGRGEFSARSREILAEVGIDPLLARENLTWAPNVAGQHGTGPQRELMTRLEAVRGDRRSIIKVLEDWAVVSKAR
ncbi:MAG: hypothetical protein AAGA68_02540 [Pseudomonadota bacterium]